MTVGRPGALLAARYRLDRLIGSPGSAERWQAYDERLARPVTAQLTLIAEDAAHEEEEAAQAALERLARLNHPGVAAVYDVGTVDDLSALGTVTYAISEWTEGRTIGQIMETGPQPWPRVADWGRQIGGALAALHSLGIVHGALGPNSIAIHDDRQVKIIDAGLGPVTDVAATDAAEGAEGVTEEVEVERPGDGGDPQDLVAGDVASGEAGRHQEADGASAEESPVKSAEESPVEAVEPATSDELVGSSELAGALGTSAGESDGVAGEAAEEEPEGDGERRAGAPVGAAGDVYALGLLLWEAAVGAAPEGVEQGTGAADLDVLRRADAPPELAALFGEMLDGNPARRPTAAAAQQRFEPFAPSERDTLPDIVVSTATTAANARTQAIVPTPSVAQTRGTGAGQRGGPPSGAAAAAALTAERERRRRRGLLVGLALLLAAVGTGVGLLIANLNPSDAAQPGLGDTSVPSVSPGTVTLPNGSPSPSPSHSSAPASVAPPVSHTPSSSPSPSSASASPSASPSPSAATGSASASAPVNDPPSSAATTPSDPPPSSPASAQATPSATS